MVERSRSGIQWAETARVVGRKFTKIIGAIHHSVEPAPDGLPLGVELPMQGFGNVSAVKGVIEPSLRLHRLLKRLVQFAHKGCAVAPSRPGCGDHCADSARGAA